MTIISKVNNNCRHSVDAM